MLHKAQCFLGRSGGILPRKNLHALRSILVQSGANGLKMSVLLSLSCGMEKYLM